MTEHGQFRPFYPNGENGRRRPPGAPKTPPPLPRERPESESDDSERFESFAFGFLSAGVIQFPLFFVTMALCFLDLRVRSSLRSWQEIAIMLAALPVLYALELFALAYVGDKLPAGRLSFGDVLYGYRNLLTAWLRTVTLQSFGAIALSCAFGCLCMSYRIYQHGWHELMVDPITFLALFSSGACAFDLLMFAILVLCSFPEKTLNKPKK